MTTMYGFNIWYDGAIVADNREEWYETESEAEYWAETEIEYKIEDWESDEIEFDEDLFEIEIIEEEFDERKDWDIKLEYNDMRM